MFKTTGLLLLCLALTAFAQTAPPATRPATGPATSADPDKMLRQLLSPSPRQQRPIDPVTYPDVQTTKPAGARADGGALIREGTYLVNRVGRLTRTAEGQQEFTFESDGQARADAPVIILPNLKLTQMETAVRANSRDLKFRVTGMITEYNQRNYILLEKVVVVQD